MKKILIIEDDVYISKLCAESLSDEGYTIFNINEGEGAFELAQQEKPDLILLDILLPGKDGYEVLEELQGSDDTKNIPVVVLSNLEQEHSLKKCITLGASGYFVKSDTNVADLANIVEKYL